MLVGCAHVAAPPHAANPSRLELRAPGEQLVLDDQVRAVRVVRDPERAGSALAVDFREDGGARLKAFTSHHVGERIAIRVAGREVALVTLRDPIEGATLLLTGRDDAEVDEMRRGLGE